ncbi:MAG: polyphenol oxidase family protein [Treponema sp.]|jgi:YfiH family protein|nr:polyphenol oxidase family protein [Treponema sp.]
MMLYPFNLDFVNYGDKKIPVAHYPFMFNGKTVPGVLCAVSGRLAGDMICEKDNSARLALFSALRLDFRRVAGLWQIHSRDLVSAGKDRVPFGVKGDGLVCAERGIALSVTVADCLPVFLYDTQSGAFALVHSGWKGTGIAVKALELMKEKWGAKAQSTAAILGPCIQPCCYNVDKERARVFAADFGGQSVRRGGGTYYLDLQAANIKLLKDAGVRNIAFCKDCTFTDGRLGSFRREGASYTRMAAVLYFPG